MYINIPRSSNKSYLYKLAKKYLGAYLICKGGVWYKVTKQYSSVNSKLVYLGETDEVFTLGMGNPYIITDEWVCSEDCYEECCTGQCNLGMDL